MSWLSEATYLNKLERCGSLDDAIATIVGDMRNRVNSTKVGLGLLHKQMGDKTHLPAIEIVQETVEHMENIINALQQYNDKTHGRGEGASDDAP